MSFSGIILAIWIDREDVREEQGKLKRKNGGVLLLEYPALVVNVFVDFFVKTLFCWHNLIVNFLSLAFTGKMRKALLIFCQLNS